MELGPDGADISTGLAEIARLIETERDSLAHKNYLEVRNYVLGILGKRQEDVSVPSAYWREELAGFLYMFDASPLITTRLREHCFHITGEFAYKYRQHHDYAKAPLQWKFDVLRREDRAGVFVEEPPGLGGFGHDIDGARINVDTLKFYECMIALSKSGVLDRLKAPDVSRRTTVLEIGAGWGGFAFQLKTLFPDVCYMVVDFPQVMLFSAVYVKTLFPNARVLLASEEHSQSLASLTDDYDFVFIPNTLFAAVNLPRLDLAMNMVSFQEMTAGQVDEYVRTIARSGCKLLYSYNKDRNRNNPELPLLSALVGRYYDLQEIRVIDAVWGGLEPNWSKARKAMKIGYRQLRQALASIRTIGSATDAAAWGYRHLVGRIR